MKRSMFVCGALLLSPLVSVAIVDTNNNGVSDLWEQQYNAGQVFSGSFDPQGDDDSDGWTNAQEAAAGTDPLNPNPPDGIIRPDIVHTPAVMGEENGQPVIVTPEAVTVSWPTLVGKQYTLLASPDLSQGSWIEVPNSKFIGEGDIHEFNFETAAGDKWFWRVAVTDLDTDGDGLVDAEEARIGSSRYLADTDGDGMNDAEAYASGKNPSGDETDADGDGVPDKDLYTVVFEVQEESHTMPFGVGWSSYDDADVTHRYLTYKDTERYTVSGSARYPDVTDAEHVWTYTHLASGTIPEDGQPVSSEQGSSFYDWKSSHETALGAGESLHEDETVTTVDGPTLTGTQIKTVTTDTTPWTVKKDGSVIRNGTAVVTVTEQYDLSNEVTYQSFWNSHVKARTWHESPPVKCGPLGGMDENRAVSGDAKAAECIRDYFLNHDFGVSGVISSPGTSYPDYGADNRLKQLRWRWIKFNPQSPFGYEYTTPPSGVRRSLNLLVRQRDFLDYREWSAAPPLTDETKDKGIVEIECKANEGTTDWQTVPLTKFDPYKLEDPAELADIDFSKWGYSQVMFGNLPVKIVPDANMVGIIGDVIDSSIANSAISHFVTPKQTEEHNQSDVELVAQGVTVGQFGQYFEWEGGDPGDAANKRKVKRITHGMTEVGIKSKTTGAIVAKMRVWVVWSSVNVTPYENVAFAPSFTVGKFLGTEGSTHAWRFVFTVLPAELFSLTTDRPNLSGKKKTKAPGEDKPHFAYAGKEADSAKWKWDVSRQVENRIYNRQMIPKSQFPNDLIYAHQPVAEETVATYPQNAAEGNDDPKLTDPDEDANPYLAFSGQGLTHAAGQISSFDGPRFPTPSAPVAAAASFVNLADFREFARLEIASNTPAEGATTWYRISDYKEWHHVLSSIYGQSTPNSQYFWGDAGSSSGEGKFNTQEEE